MKIIFFGASSQIAKGLIKKFSKDPKNQLIFFVRNLHGFSEWSINEGMPHNHSSIKTYSEFSVNDEVDVIINCIGIGDPAKAIKISESIDDTTNKFDDLILHYLALNPNTKYIFLSSGIAYGDIFSAPARNYDQQNIKINSSEPKHQYAISKIKAENKHRQLSKFSIVDIRIFSYLSDEIDINNKFFITDALRAIKEDTVFLTNKKNITRDYIGVDDLYQLIDKLIAVDGLNTIVDAYSKEPIDKFTILEFLKSSFGLRYQFQESFKALNATGDKDHYYSKNFFAKDFGYSPKYSSIEVIEMVANKILMF